MKRERTGGREALRTAFPGVKWLLHFDNFDLDFD